MINLDIVTKSSTISDFYPEYLVQSPSVTPGKVRIGLQIRMQPHLWRTKKGASAPFVSSPALIRRTVSPNPHRCYIRYFPNSLDSYHPTKAQSG